MCDEIREQVRRQIPSRKICEILRATVDNHARLQLAQSQVTRAEAARNLQVRRIRFALLPALPLVAASASAVQNAGSTASQTQTRTQTTPAATGAAGPAGTSGGR